MVGHLHWRQAMHRSYDSRCCIAAAGGKHLQILRESGVGDDDIARLVTLPPGHSRGMVVALLKMGKTWLTQPEDRKAAEQRVVARAEDMGRYHTEIIEAVWLEEGIPMKGQPGTWDVEVPRSRLPAKWASALDQPNANSA